MKRLTLGFFRKLSAIAMPSLAFACSQAVTAAETPSTQPIERAQTNASTATLRTPSNEWKVVSFGSYLIPKNKFYDSHNRFNIVFHFHGSVGAHHDWKNVPVNAVVVGADLGVGGNFYQRTMADPSRFEDMVNEVTTHLQREVGNDKLRVGRIALFSFSAGYGATQEIVHHPRYGKYVDTVVLLDGLHGSYERTMAATLDGTTPSGAKRVSPDSLASFVEFARRAAKGEKTMVITHSSIVPPGYPSTEESAGVLIDAVRAERVEDNAVTFRGMKQKAHVDLGQFHVLGFRGDGPANHMDHLHLVGDIAKLYLIPTWGTQMAL